jgi:hypothetical protein
MRRNTAWRSGAATPSAANRDRLGGLSAVVVKTEILEPAHEKQILRNSGQDCVPIEQA